MHMSALATCEAQAASEGLTLVNGLSNATGFSA
jgi:hypothetical protein